SYVEMLGHTVETTNYYKCVTCGKATYSYVVKNLQDCIGYFAILSFNNVENSGRKLDVTEGNLGKVFFIQDNRSLKNFNEHKMEIVQGVDESSVALMLPNGNYLAFDDAGNVVEIAEVNEYSSWYFEDKKQLKNVATQLYMLGPDSASGVFKGTVSADPSGSTTNMQFHVFNIKMTILDCAHDYSVKEDVTGNCLVASYKMFECSLCGELHKEESSLGEHSYVEIGRTPATCESAEEIVYSCTLCSNVLTRTGEPALEHDYSVKKIVSDPTCLVSGTATMVCSHCGKDDGVVFDDADRPAFGHDPSDWKDIGDGTHHVKVCQRTNCAVILEIEEHIFGSVVAENINGATCTEVGTYDNVSYCVCGHEMSRTATTGALGHSWGPWEMVADKAGTSIRHCANDLNHEHSETTRFILGYTITTSTGPLMNCYTATNALVGYSDLNMRFTKPIYDASGNVIREETTVVSDYAVKSSGTVFSYDGIGLAEMGVVFKAELYSGDDFLASLDYSAITYVYSQLAKTSNSPDTQTMLVDMLYMGEKAQLHHGYLVDQLVTDRLTDEQRAFRTQTGSVINGNIMNVEAGEEDGVHVLDCGIDLTTKVGTTYKFSIGKYNIDEISMVFSLNTSAGIIEDVISCKDAVMVEDGVYSIVYYGIAMDEYRRPYTLKFVDNNGQTIGDVVTFSVETLITEVYSNTTDETLKDLLMSIMTFSDSHNIYEDLK
ncbi:MAG: hypothetical protein J6V77_01460, partial [Clostridia bacterium]|nr:hypothetical protein [Clostridia bacterium]